MNSAGRRSAESHVHESVGLSVGFVNGNSTPRQLVFHFFQVGSAAGLTLPLARGFENRNGSAFNRRILGERRRRR